MYETYTDIGIFLRKVTGQMFGAIDRTVLASRAAEAHHEACESAARICLDMRTHDPVNMFKETDYFPVIFEETYHRLVAAGKFLVRLVTSGIMYRTAIEYKASAIT